MSTTTLTKTTLDHKTGTREEWLAARLDLLAAEKELTRRSDELARRRRELPWVRLDKDYVLHTEHGDKSLPELFGGRSQLIVYHFMYGPAYTAGCPSCSAIADGFNGVHTHLQAHDVAFWAVSRAPLGQLLGYRARMGWTFPWASSADSDFCFDFHTSHTEEEWDAGAVDYNFELGDMRPPEGTTIPILDQVAATTGTTWKDYRREGPGMSAFVLADGEVYHTYSAYSRGIDALWGMYPWLDRAPLGRNEEGNPFWFKRHDEYAEAVTVSTAATPATPATAESADTGHGACCH